MTDLQAHLAAALAGRYTIERELGQGGMAVVFLATDLTRRRPVAIKAVRPEVTLTIGAERFLREIALVARLNHPHILALFDSGDARGVAYFVMPFVEGPSLRERLNRETQLPVEEALQITREVADALAYAHRQGIIHRDVKPENILLANGHALVADFGIARASDAGDVRRLTETGMAVGTPNYMSPEQVTASDQIDGRSDLYSLACVLYEMLTGSPPFTGPTAQVILGRQLLDPVPPVHSVRAGVPEAVDRVLQRALAKTAADRYTSVTGFVDALDLARTGGERPWLRRELRWGALGVVVVLIGLGAGAAWLLIRPPPRNPRRVLVGVFEDRTADRSLGTLVLEAASEISSGLAGTDSAQVSDARTLDPGSASPSDLPGLRRVAGRVGATSIVWGTADRRGDSLDFRIHLSDAATGDLLRPIVPVRGASANHVQVLRAVGQRVMAAYVAQHDPRFRNYATIGQPGTYEAYQAFQEGVAAGSGVYTDSSQGEARRHFRRAMELDPDFIAPRTALAWMFAVGNECARVDSVVKAFRVDNFALLRADQADLDYSVAWCHHDLHGKYQAAGRSYQDAPDFWPYRFLLAFEALEMNRPGETVALLETVDPVGLPKEAHSGYLWVLTKAYHQLGEYAEALKAVDRGRLEIPDDDLLDRHEMRQRAALGQVDRVNALLGTRVAKSSLGHTAGEDMFYFGQELKGHGQPESGRAVCERGVAWYATRPSLTGEDSTMLADILYCAERWSEAKDAYQRLAAGDSTGVGLRTRLGALAARRGDRAEVAKWDVWLGRHLYDKQGVLVPAAVYGRAVLAAFLGDRERALAFFQVAWERGWPDVGTIHLDPDLAPLRDYPPFRTLVATSR